MKTAINRITMQALCVVSLTTGAFAQSANSAANRTQVDMAAQEKHEARFREGMETAAAHAKRGDIGAAEHTLFALIERKPNTAQWHLSAAQRLLHLATDLAQDAKKDQSAKLIQKALAQLETATQLAAEDPSARAAACMLKGFIYERYLGELGEAKTSYAAALAAEPASSRAQEAVARLAGTEVGK